MAKSFNDYQDYINIFLLYFDPSGSFFETQVQFSYDSDKKILPYFTFNSNGLFQEGLIASYFKNNSLNNLILLDMLQNPFVDNIVQSNLIDEHLLYLVSTRKEHNSYIALDEKMSSNFFNKYPYCSSFRSFSSKYYSCYSDQTTFDTTINSFPYQINKFINNFKKAVDNIHDKNSFLNELGVNLTSIFNQFSHLIENTMNFHEANDLSNTILKTFISNRDLLINIFDNLDIAQSPLFDNLHEGYHVVQKFNDTQLHNLAEAKKRLEKHTIQDEDFFNQLTIFFEIGASIIANIEKFSTQKDLFTFEEKKETDDFLYDYKFLLFQSDIHCLKLFIQKTESVEPESPESNKEKRKFIDKYAQSIKNIEHIYNQHNVSLFDDNYLSFSSFKEVLPLVLEEIDNILISFNQFYQFEFNNILLNNFRKTFKDNLFIGLCQNKVVPEIFKDLHLNYDAFLREIELSKKLTSKSVSDNTLRIKHKI